MDPRENVFITAAALGERIAAGAPLSILAVRNPRAPEHAAAPRIPGAIDIDLPTELAAPGGGTRGSRPLPAIAALQDRRHALGPARTTCPWCCTTTTAA